MRLHGEAAARAMGGVLEGAAAVADGVSIDSRTLVPGSLFFAIRGPRHDGHAFVADAVRRGAPGAVVERGYRGPPGELRDHFLIRVSDPTAALGALAREERLKSAVRIVAITGSLGKTTTKEAAAAAIGAGHTVFRSRGNLNNQWGLPLSLLAREEEEVGVVELGMSAPGEIQTLTEIAVPDCGVLTTIAEAHLEYFGSVEAIADAKGELFQAMPAGGTAVVNADDERVLAQADRFSGRRVTYGFSSGVDVRGWDYNPSERGIGFAASAFGGPAVNVSCRLRGRHNASNVLAGLAAATVLDVSLGDAAAAVRTLSPLPGRGRRIELSGGAILVDETYNSSPRALKALLRELASEPALRRILVVGDMLELGGDAERIHHDCGDFASGLNLDLVVGVGPLGAVVARVLEERKTPVRFAADPEEAAEFLSGELDAGDLVLLKASRAVGLERAIHALQAAAPGGNA